jgi:hypothetical protein
MKSLLILVAALLVTTGFAILPGAKRADDMSQPCAMCEFVAQVVEGFVSSTSTEDEIFNFLEKACSLVSAPYNSQVGILI